jgi:hypothetical protein
MVASRPARPETTPEQQSEENNIQDSGLKISVAGASCVDSSPSPTDAPTSPPSKSLAALFPGQNNDCTPISISTGGIHYRPSIQEEIGAESAGSIAKRRLSLSQSFGTPVQCTPSSAQRKSISKDVDDAAALSSGLVKERRKSFMSPTAAVATSAPASEPSSTYNSPSRRLSTSGITPLVKPKIEQPTPSSSVEKKIIFEPVKLKSLASEKPLGITDDNQPILSYQELLRRNFSKDYEVLLERPDGESNTIRVKEGELEMYLSSEEFLSVFKVSRVEFLSFPKWKQIDLKKKTNLF